MTVLTSPPCTPEEYLRMERNASLKSEYINGQIYAMAGASRRHNLITFNLAMELGPQLTGQDCEAYLNDMRVKVSPTTYTYPDVVAVCGEPRFEDNEVDTLLNPQVIIEVLSPSTEARDRGVKFAQYRRIASLTDYVLIDQDRVGVEHYKREGDRWMLNEIMDLQGNLQLESISCRLSLQGIYNKIRFAEYGDDTG